MKRILVVDDNTEYLQVLSTVLSSDFDTIKAKGVKEALDILQEITVDAVCSDFNMEDGTGLDLLEIIRQQGLKTPFLLMKRGCQLRTNRQSIPTSGRMKRYRGFWSVLTIWAIR